MSNLFKSNVVYKFTCSRDESIAYIGETQRCIFERIADHTDKTKESAIIWSIVQNVAIQKTSAIHLKSYSNVIAPTYTVYY